MRLATQRGQAPSLTARRRFDQGEEKALAHAVVLTLVQLRPEGLRRHDVLLYEVSRGQLSAFTVTLPAGLEVETAATDEGLVVPIVAGRELRVERRRQLAGTGYLVLSSTPDPAGELPLRRSCRTPRCGPVSWRWPPRWRPRSRRCRRRASARSISATCRRCSARRWARSTLPRPGGCRTRRSRCGCASRRCRRPPRSPPRVLRRDTTTLLTVDGTLLHRETFDPGAFGPPGLVVRGGVAGRRRLVVDQGRRPADPAAAAGRQDRAADPAEAGRRHHRRGGGGARAGDRAGTFAAGGRAGAHQRRRCSSTAGGCCCRRGRKYRYSSGELQPVPARVVYLATPKPQGRRLPRRTA